MNTYLIMLIVYSIGLTAAGLWVSRLVRGAGDFFVAGRRLNAPLLFSTVLAANIGAGTTVGAAGLAYEQGLSAWWWNGAAGIGSLGLAFLIGPRIWRLAKQHNFYTSGDYLEFRYGPSVRGVITSLIWVGTLAILAGQLIAGSAVLNVVAGIPKSVGAIIGAILMTIYFVAGGLLSSAWVNMIQLTVVVAGFLIAIPLLSGDLGGWSSIAATTPPHEAYWDVMYSVGFGMSGWAMLAILTPSFMTSPGLVQKVYGAQDERTIRWGVATQGIAQMLFGLIPVFFGIAALAAGLEIASPNLVLPTVLATQLPVWIGALALAAVFSAEVSTCDAILFMLSTSLSKDLYKRFVNPAADDARVLLVARLAAVAGGIAGVILAIKLETVVGALGIFYSLVGVSLFVPFVGGLYTRRPGTPAALASIFTGIATLLWFTYRLDGRGFGWFSPNLIALSAAAVAYIVVTLVRRSDIPTGV